MNAETGQPSSTLAKPGAKPTVAAAKDDLKSLPMGQWGKRLDSTQDGLTQAEAQKRLEKFGPNEIKEEKENSLLKFFS